MQKLHRTGLLFTLFALLVSACSAPTPQPTANSPVPSRTTAPTAQPSRTPRPSPQPSPTQIITPTAISLPEPGTLAYLQSFPNWVEQSVPTATLAPANKCSVSPVMPEATPVFVNTVFQDVDNPIPATDEEILAFLNTYGFEPLVGKDTVPGRGPYPAPVMLYQDLTNDGVADLMINQSATVRIYGCINGEIKTLFIHDATEWLEPIEILNVQDLNHNGIPEFYAIIGELTQAGRHFQAFEWNGTEFERIIGENPNMEIILAPGYLVFKDTDKDGWIEIVGVSEIPLMGTYWDGLPWREEYQTYKWNGEFFQRYRVDYAPPEFRFQAVQDGDQAILFGEEERALMLYQDAIFSDELDWYSEARRETMREQWGNLQNPSPQPTAPLPSPDPLEYPYLAAYAYYRIILIHLSLGDLAAAQVVYDTLRTKFPTGQPGSIYTQMATEFWSEYSASGDMTQACTRTIQFAGEHYAEATRYLGNAAEQDYFGFQSLFYSTDRLCPY